MYTYDRTAAVQEKVFTDGTGRPTGPNTPWGKADGVREITRGVRWVNTPGHGGLGVAKGVADTLLSAAARRLGDYQGGYFWYEEDVQCSIPFFEHPEWATAIGSSSTKEHEEETIKKYYPKYFEYLSSGVKDPPKLKPGMKLKFLVPARFGSEWTFKEGDVVEVVSTTASSIIFSPIGRKLEFKAPMGYYYGHGPSATRHLEAVD
jgi:hypothetical protein